MYGTQQGIARLSFMVIQLCVRGIGDNHPKFLLSHVPQSSGQRLIPSYGTKLLLPRIAEPGYGMWTSYKVAERRGYMSPCCTPEMGHAHGHGEYRFGREPVPDLVFV
ncbi:hypothetical protein BD310DRAFT_911970 [Dichomitus squalens]|uniref:Uncharacterized protein n=2 Tax=Dichomitus squalens TaxID=114155 RepID=A0A4Q9QD68_9APHY|nr:hypothetical protein BD310DRAFT_914670 [Dichomitus squalens]TBU65743.1 hypothetical protein BD310DRAFT_911970 [Dichomitus squalens]